MSERTIVIHFAFPPIPSRQFDFVAYFDGDEPNDAGRMLCGYGRTPYRAVKDLIEEVQWEAER